MWIVACVVVVVVVFLFFYAVTESFRSRCSSSLYSCSFYIRVFAEVLPKILAVALGVEDRNTDCTGGAMTLTVLLVLCCIAGHT